VANMKTKLENPYKTCRDPFLVLFLENANDSINVTIIITIIRLQTVTFLHEASMSLQQHMLHINTE
jgi:hypothetical protein